MNISSWSFYPCIVFALLAAAAQLGAQEADGGGAKQSAQPVDQAFHLNSYADVQRIKGLRASVITECRNILDRRANEKPPSQQLDVQAAMAAELLGELGARDAASVDALCHNLALTRSLGEDCGIGPSRRELDGIAPNVNLSGGPTSILLQQYVVMQALRQIGGPQVAEGLFRRMKHPLSRQELLLCALSLAFVEKNKEERLISLARVRAALDRAAKQPESKQLMENLSRVSNWLEDPEFRIGNPTYTPAGSTDY